MSAVPAAFSAHPSAFADRLSGAEVVARITPAALRQLLSESGEIAVVDVREEGVRAGSGHILQSVPLPLSQIEADDTVSFKVWAWHETAGRSSGPARRGGVGEGTGGGWLAPPRPAYSAASACAASAAA